MGLPKQTLDYFKIAESVPALIAVYNITTGKYLYVNRTLKKILGYAPKEFVQGGMPFVASLVHPNDLPRILQENEEALNRANRGDHTQNTEPIINFEYRMRHKKGHWVWLHTDASVFSRGIDKKVECVLNASLDITQRKSAEEKLQQAASEKVQASEEKYRYLFDANIIGVFISDFDGTFLEANAALLKLIGYTREDLAQKKIHRDILTPPEYDHLSKQAIKALEGSGSSQTYEKEYIRKDGKRIPVLIAVTRIGRSKTCIGFVVDITDRKELEKRKDDFLNMTSHELKTPLTSMKMYLEVLRKQQQNGNSEKAFYITNKIQEQTNKLSGLVNDLLDVSRITTGKLTLKRELFLVDELIAETVEAIQTTTAAHTIKYRNGLRVRLMADRYRLYQVLVNLLTNAIKYSPAGKEVIVSLQKNHTHALVSIQDFGIGIAKKQQEKIFDKLYQVPDMREKTYPGLGIGLYIAKEIIERHHGRLWVESTKGKGATFYVALPLDNAS